MRVVIKRPGNDPEEQEMQNTLQAAQRLVDGLIEIPALPGLPKGVDLVCNEEGLLKGMRPNLAAQGGTLIVGPVVFLSHTRDGEWQGLTDKQVKEVFAFCGKTSIEARYARATVSVVTAVAKDVVAESESKSKKSNKKNKEVS